MEHLWLVAVKKVQDQGDRIMSISEVRIFIPNMRILQTIYVVYSYPLIRPTGPLSFVISKPENVDHGFKHVNVVKRLQFDYV